MKASATLSTLWARKPPPVGTTPADVVYRENKMTLLRYRPRAEGVKYRLRVPSVLSFRHQPALRLTCSW
ncbi:MAG: hypothetical protein R3F14_38795 [Polyangiaceae bacterium]